MAILKPYPYVSTKHLSWNSKDRTFSAEMSDFGGRAFSQVFDDACDVGFTLWSQYPGYREMVMVVNHTETDREREVVYWDLVPEDRSIKVSFKVRIFND